MRCNFINISEKVKYRMNNFDLTLEDVFCMSCKYGEMQESITTYFT